MNKNNPMTRRNPLPMNHQSGLLVHLKPMRLKPRGGKMTWDSKDAGTFKQSNNNLQRQLGKRHDKNSDSPSCGMNRVNQTKSEDRSRSGSQSEESTDGHASTPSVSDSKKEEMEDDSRSQEDVKSEKDVNASTGRMALRDRRKRARPNYRYSPELTPAPAPPAERRSSARTEKSAGSMNSSNDVSHWLQCDLCHKWRIVAHKLFEDLKKQSQFQCRNLQGVTCKDRDDWAGSGGSEDVSMKDDASVGYYKKTGSRKQVRRINIYAGRFIPGFGGEFSDLEE